VLDRSERIVKRGRDGHGEPVDILRTGEPGLVGNSLKPGKSRLLDLWSASVEASAERGLGVVG
jgi:hypothetical protein